MSGRIITVLLVSLLCLWTSATQAASLGPTPYLQASDSPFAGGSFVYFHLEDFEDQALNTPGLSGSPGGVTSLVFGPSIHDSVDADDSAIDGSGLQGESWFSGAGSSGVSFTFDASILGTLPTHAGIVWTDGGGDITFQAFGPGDVLLGTIGPVSGIADGSFNGETAEDRFFGWSDAGGISRIFISNSSGGIEVDHVQYGFAEQDNHVIPAPAALWGGLALLAAMLRRRPTRTV